MTTETRDYETLEDRALDALVAERVMGWPKMVVEGLALGPMHYSTDPAAAFTVLEAMRAKGYFVGMSGSAERWNAAMHHPTNPGAIVAHDDSMPRAAVIAALRALDAEAE